MPIYDVCCICGRYSIPLHAVDVDTYICDDCANGKKEAPRKKSHNWNDIVTPKTFNTYIGQEPIKKELKTMIKATKLHKIPIQHTLFSGGFGLGKTTLAHIFADAIGSNEYVNASDLHNKKFPESKVVIIDEIHTLLEDEWLLTLMDRENRTIIGATTTVGSLSGPLRSRFISMVLQPYTVEELQQIVKGAAKNLKYDCPDFVSYEVAKRGKAVARTAVLLFKRIYDRIVLNNKKVTEETLNSWFNDMKIDSDGLDNADRAYLQCLSDKPIGLQNIAAMTGLDRVTLEEAIEPYLLTSGFITRTSRGRILGNKIPAEIWGNNADNTGH